MNKQDAQQIASLMLKVRRLKKMLSTYYIRLADNTYPDGCVRGYFIHCSTMTGRLTSDLQQVPKKKVAKVKRMFVSRYDN